jgi:hypothetical protein
MSEKSMFRLYVNQERNPICKYFLLALSVALLIVCLSDQGKAADDSVLDQNDVAARQTLTLMAATGTLKDRVFAESWIVISSVAMGMGFEKCSFPQSDEAKQMWRPALQSMSPDEIYTLNRVVTSNFRNAERNGRLLLDRLFPVTRQAVLILSNGKGKWNCSEISKVFDAARNFIKNNGADPSPRAQERQPESSTPETSASSSGNLVIFSGKCRFQLIQGFFDCADKVTYVQDPAVSRVVFTKDDNLFEVTGANPSYSPEGA